MAAHNAGIILVAVDGSEAARNAAHVAVKLARLQGYIIHALYIVDEALALESYSDYHKEVTFHVNSDRDDPVAVLETQGALALEEVEILAQDAGVPMKPEMLLGNVTDLILDRAEGALMIAVGRRGNRHANKPDHLGSHFWQIVHKARVPVIAGGDVVPERAHRVLFVFAGDQASLKALHGVTILQQDLQLDVIVVLAGDPDEAQAKDWQEQVLARVAKKDRAHYHFVSRPEKQADALVAVAKEESVDFIVMSAEHRRLAVLHDIFGNPLDDVLQRTSLPVIIVH
jgi:nucleotide-binding universal stress UspA family protein